MSGSLSFTRNPLPPMLCNRERLLASMDARSLDGVVVTSANNVFYLSGFNGIAHKSDEPRPYAVVYSRHRPEDPVLVVADYYVNTVASQPSWIEDVRAFRAVMMPMDLPADPTDIDRFIPQDITDEPWVAALRSRFADGFGSAVRSALDDLGLAHARVGFDDLRVAHQIPHSGIVADAYDTLMEARAIKTPVELELLQRATALNEQAIRDAIASWDRGMTFREFNHAYHKAAIELGGFIRDPGGMVWGHLRGADAAVTLQAGFEDFEVEPGIHMMFDCHGTLDLYCWDGGKTWVVEGEPQGEAARIATATADATEAVLEAMKPGARISELQATGRAAFRKSGVPDADSALIFFHGLGLSHMDLAQHHPDGTPNADWALEANMVVPVHILYPGGDRQRMWVEEVAVVTDDGGRPLFSWGFEPIAG